MEEARPEHECHKGGGLGALGGSEGNKGSTEGGNAKDSVFLFHDNPSAGPDYGLSGMMKLGAEAEKGEVGHIFM